MEGTGEVVYNFEIAEHHNYYVGESGVLVHNGNCIANVLNDFLDNHNIIKNWKGTQQELQVFRAAFIADFGNSPTFATVFRRESSEISLEAYKSLYDAGKSNLRKNIDVIKSLTKLQDALKTKYPNLEWDKIVKNLKSVEAQLEILAKLKDKDGLNQVLSDIAQGGNKAQGAIFIIEHIRKMGSNADNFIASIKKFESYDSNASRYYDVELHDNTKFEFKSWYKTWNATTFRTQFLKDLPNMSSLGNIKWIFNKSQNFTDLDDLRKKVLEAIGTQDKITGKWTAGQELISAYSRKSPAFWTLLFGNNQNPINNADDLINALNNKNNFKEIFEIVE